MAAIAILLLSCIPAVLAAPTVSISISSQLPPVGRVGEEYAFTLFEDTFASSSTLSYTVSNLPAWLIFDQDLLYFEGTPTSDDVDSTVVTVTASDGSDTAKDTFTVLVTDQPAPAVHLGFPTQIASSSLHVFSSVNVLPSDTGVYIHPYYSFSLGFQQDTFRPAYDADSDHQDIYYSAHVRGTGTLPDWLVYANDTNTFTGVAPASGSFTVVVVGSDYWGFDAVESSFLIEIGTDYFDLEGGKDSLANITTVAGETVDYTLNLTSLTLDGVVVGDSDITVAADLTDYDWLTFDATALSLSGTVPDNYVNGSVSNQYIPLTITSSGNATDASISLWVQLLIEPSTFTAVNLPNVTANPGSQFSFSLAPYIRNSSTISALNFSSTATSLASWLSLDASTLTLSGTVPNASFLASNEIQTRATTDATVPIVFSATDSTTGLASTASLSVELSGVASTTTATSATATSTGSTAGSSSSSKSHGLSTGAKIALGVVFGLLGLLLLCLLLFCCCRRRKAKKDETEKPRPYSTDGDSFVATVKSPKSPREGFFAKPFGILNYPTRNGQEIPTSESAKLHLGEIPRFSSIYIHRPSDAAGEQPTPELADVDAEANKPRQMPALKGILNWGGAMKEDKSELSQLSFPPLSPPTPVEGEIIRGGLEVPGEPSDFTHDLTSGSSGDRASWESRSSFQWSSQEGSQPRIYANGATRPVSGAPSLPRPRQDFTPRYPRNASPTAMALLVRPPSEAISQHDFSEFNHSHEQHDSSCSGSMSGTHSGSGATHSFVSGSGSGSSHPSASSGIGSPERVAAAFPPGPSGLSRIIGDSGHFSNAEDEEDRDGYNSDDSIVVTRAQRQALANNAAADGHKGPRLMPSRERFAHSPTAEELPEASKTPSEEAVALNDDAFDDADEESRRPDSTAYAPSAFTDLQGLGYPAEAIYFGSPGDKRQSATSSAVSPQGGQRIPSIRPVPGATEVILSPPLPQMGNIMQTLHGNRRSMKSANTALVDGKYMAQANESFTLHPRISPPPVVSLSSSTWSAPPPSTYRAEGLNGKALPGWLHWDNKELELWGIPSLHDAGQVIDVRIIERMPKEKRKSNDSSMVIPQTATEREVGKCTIEVIDSVRSPDAFSLDGFASPT